MPLRSFIVWIRVAIVKKMDFGYYHRMFLNTLPPQNMFCGMKCTVQ